MKSMSESKNEADLFPGNGTVLVPASASDPSDPSGSAVEYPSVCRAVIISVGASLGLFLVGLDMTIVANAIPSITDDFEGINLVGWYGSAFFLVLACFQPFWGKVYLFFSVKYTFIVSICIFLIGSLISGFAPGSTVLILGRAFTGAGAAGIASGGYAVLGVVVRPQLRPIFTGFVTTLYSVASVLGPILGGAFTEHLTWRWCFYINLPIGAASAIIIVLLFHPRRPPDDDKTKTPLKEKLLNMDPIGIILALASLIFFTRALQVAGIYLAWDSGEVVGLLVASFVTAMAFLLSQCLQRKSSRALIMSRLAKQRVVAMAMAFGFFHEGAFYLLLYYLPIFFEVSVGLTPSEAGLHILPLLISCGIASSLSGLIVSRWGHSTLTPLMLWAGAGGCIGAGLIYTLSETSSPAKWIGYQILAGLGYGCGLPLPIIASHNNAQAQDLASLTGMVLFAEAIGSSTSMGVGQAVLSNLIVSKITTLTPDVDPLTIIATGATEIRSSFPAHDIAGIIEAYLYSTHAVFLIVTAYAGVATLVAVCNTWERPKLST